ncbi:MAG TPA: prepilin-type N-terminal cleavage/methylation domain-containing protein, partial [Mollicutes bacterium]|nr:prepilin-type N-terminal cleavage/methylation domain-containing protein [Mollicutes bacterium]
MKKGFTLVELLAVIVILAIILAIAVPGISNMIDNSKRSSFESSAKLVLKGLELKMLEDDGFNPLDINETNINNLLNIDASNYEKIIVKEVNKELYVTIIGKNKWEGLTVSGNKESTRTYETQINYVRGVNAPVLAPGMKPIKWNGTTWVETTENDSEWY